MKKYILTLIGVVGLFAAPAIAQEMSFAMVDGDANGFVTLEEATTAGWEWTEEQFAGVDTDADGALSEDEFLAATAG